MYAPKQYRPERKPKSQLLVVPDVDAEKSLPEQSAFAVIEPRDEEKEAEEKAEATREEHKEKTGEVQDKSDSKKSAVRGEQPPQFKMASEGTYQFKSVGGPVQMKEGSGGGSGGGGNGVLPDHVRSQMEGAFNTNFSDVKVTANSSAATQAGALAFAQGNNIHFAPGQYNPESKGGQELLGHELAHVVQQRQGRVQANSEVNGMAVNNDKGLEAEADSLGAKAAQFKLDGSSSAPVSGGGSTASGPAQMKMEPGKEEENEEHLEEEKADKGKKAKHQKDNKEDGEDLMAPYLALNGFEEADSSEDAGEDAQRLKQNNQEDLANHAGEEPAEQSDEHENEPSEEQSEDAYEASDSQAETRSEGLTDGMESKGATPEEKAAKAGEETKEPENKEVETKNLEAESAETEGGEAGEKGGAESKDAAASGGGDGAAAGGGGEDAAAGGGGEGGGAVQTPAMEPMPVVSAQNGGFGEGEEPQLTLVNEAALKEESGPVLKKNADGSAVVLSSAVNPSTPSAGEPVQMKPDPTKEVPVRKPVSGGQTKDLFAANREKNQASLAAFESDAKSRVAGLESGKSVIAGRIAEGAASAKASILQAAAAEKARMAAGFEALKAQMMADAERIKSEVRTAAETAKAAIAATATTARTNVETAFQAQDAAFVALEPEIKAKFTASFDKGKADMVKSATELGLQAKKRGEERAAEFDDRTRYPVPSQSWDEDLLNGSDYEENRHKARVEAAKQVGLGYQEQFLKTANEEGDKFKAAGEAETHNYVTTSVSQSRQAIADRKAAALEAITSAETAAVASITASADATCNGVDAAAQAGVSALDQQLSQGMTQIDGTAQGKVQAVDAAAQEKTLNLEMQVQSAIDGLNSQINSTVTRISSQKNPAASKVQASLKRALAGIDRGVQQGMGVIEEGTAAVSAGLAQTAAETATELNGAATAILDGGSQTADAMRANFEGQRDSFVTSAQGIQEAANQNMTEAAESAAKDMKDQYDAVVADFNKAVSALDGKMSENSTGFKNNIQEQLNGIDKEIDKKAQEAYDAVQPRWVSWLLAAIDILVVIAITAILIVCLIPPACGVLALICIGAAAGAVGGAIKYGARVGLTSEEFSGKKLANEMLAGAVDGANIAVGMIPGLGLAGRALTQIGAGALGGAIKYGGDVLLGGEKFSWKMLAGKTFLGGLEGAIGLIGGEAGDGVAKLLTKEVGGEVVESLGRRVVKDVAKTGVEAFFDTVGGGLQAVGDEYLKTGTLDWSKFKEQFTLEEFAKNFATSKITDFAADKASGHIANAVGKSSPDSNSGNGSSTSSDSKTTTTDSNSSSSNKDTNSSSTDSNSSSNKSTDTPTNKDTDTPTNKDTDTPTNKDTDTPTNKDTDTPTNKDTDTPTNKDSNSPISNDGTVNLPTNKDNNNPNKDTDAPTNKPDTDTDKPTHKGQQQADALGYPAAPDGYKWIATASGEPYLRRESGRKQDLPPVKFDPDTKTFKPEIPAPDGYHWQLADGKFSLHPDPNLADSLPPIQYDPKTEGFATADGKPFSGDLSSTPVRGTDLDGFTKSVKGLDADPVTAKQAYDLFAKKDWAALEKLFTEKGLNGGWPPNRGFIDVKDGVLPVGSSFDRFGGWTDEHGNFQDKGTFVAPYGADFDGRALPDDTKNKPLNGYEVIKPIPMKEGDAIPWFGKPGGGKQYELSMGINDLIAGGYIKKIDAPDLSNPKDKTTADPSKTETNTTPDPTKTDTNTTPDPTKTDGGDGTKTNGNDTDGGGMKGKDVYPVAPEGQRVSEMTPAEVAKAVEDAAGRKGRLPEGAKVTPTDTPGKFVMSFPDPANPKKTKTIDIVVNTNFDPSKAKTSHGDDQGAAMNTITVKDGKVTATVELGGNHNKADADKMMVHELGEIADIVSQIDALKAKDAKEGKTTSDADIQKLIGEQQQASVFAPGADPAKMTPENMTAHDRAAVAEIGSLASEFKNATTPEAAAEARAKLMRLGESMGITDPKDPRMKIISDQAGPLNGEQIAAICGRQPAPEGYKWVGDADKGLAVENEPGNKKQVLHYDPNSPSGFSPAPDKLPLVPATKSTKEFQLGDTKSEASNPKKQNSTQEINVSRDDIAKRDIKIDEGRAKSFETINERLAAMGLTPIDAPEGKKNAGELLAALEAKRKEVQDKRGPQMEKPAENASAEEKAAYEKWKKDNYTVALLSEQIGEVAAMSALEGMVPGLKPLDSALSGNGKQGQFDLIYRGPDGTIYIVESKGGSADLGTKKGQDASGKDVDLQQGTPEYMQAILDNMKREVEETGDPGLMTTIIEIEAALNIDPPKIKYLHASQKIGESGEPAPDLNITKFEI